MNFFYHSIRAVFVMMLSSFLLVAAKGYSISWIWEADKVDIKLSTNGGYNQLDTKSLEEHTNNLYHQLEGKCLGVHLAVTCQDHDTTFLQNILGVFSKFDNVETLKFGYNGVSVGSKNRDMGKGISAFVDSLKPFKSLTSLELKFDADKLTGEFSFLPLAELKNLKNFSCSTSTSFFSDEYLIGLKEGLQSMQANKLQLESISFSHACNNRLTAEQGDRLKSVLVGINEINPASSLKLDLVQQASYGLEGWRSLLTPLRSSIWSTQKLSLNILDCSLNILAGPGHPDAITEWALSKLPTAFPKLNELTLNGPALHEYWQATFEKSRSVLWENLQTVNLDFNCLC